MIFNRLSNKERNLLAFLLERLRHIEITLAATELRKAKDLKLSFSRTVNEAHRLLKIFNVDISEVWSLIRPKHTIDDRPGRRSQVFDVNNGLTYLVRYQPMELSPVVERDFSLIQFDTQEDADYFFLHDPDTAGQWHVVRRLDKQEDSPDT